MITQLHTKIGTINIPILFDCNGNLYLEYANQLHQLNVDLGNNPCFYSGNFKIIEDSENIPEFGIIMRSLHTTNCHDDLSIEDRGYIYDLQKKRDYFDEMCESFGYQNEENCFVFYQAPQYKINVRDREYGYVDALYDAYIYNDLEIPDLIFHSELKGETCTYRVCIYENGQFFFRSHGSNIENKYELCVDENNIIVKKCN